MSIYDPIAATEMILAVYNTMNDSSDTRKFPIAIQNHSKPLIY